MKHRFRVVSTIAIREVRTAIRTKTFWFFTLLYPILLAIPVLVIVGSMVVLVDVDEDVNVVFADGIESFKEEWRFLLRGQILKYAVLDETADLSSRVRNQIDRQNKDLLVFEYGRPRESRMVENYQDWRESFGPYFDYYPKLSLNHFREVDETDVPIETLNTWILQDKIVGYFVLPESLVDTNKGARFVHRKTTQASMLSRLNELKSWYESLTTLALKELRGEEMGVNTEQFEDLMIRVSADIDTIVSSNVDQSVGSTTEQQSINSSSVSIAEKVAAVPYLLLLALVWGSGSYLVLTSTIEEKASRVGEMLVSNVDPLSLMDGKVIGNVLVVGIALLTWVVVIGLPSLGLLAVSGLVNYVLDPHKVLNFFIFGTFAFLSFGYLNAALGSTCSDIKETLYVNQPFVLIAFFVVLPMMVFVLLHPDSVFASTMSFIPPLTALFMVARTAALPDLPMYLFLVLLMGSSLLLIRHVSVRIFLPGLLLERKFVNLISLFKFVRQPK